MREPARARVRARVPERAREPVRARAREPAREPEPVRVPAWGSASVRAVEGTVQVSRWCGPS